MTTSSYFAQDRRLRVLHISTYDAMGGAARAARRIHQGLLDMGLDSQMLVWRKSSEDSSIRQFMPSRSVLQRARLRIRRETRERQRLQYDSSRRDPFQPFSDDRSDCLVDVSAMYPAPDIVNLFWVAGFPDVSFFFRHLPQNIPIVWRLSDMNPFTGGCHYAWDCERWTAYCGACPELGSSQEDDLSRRIWQRKHRAYQKHRIHIVAPSQWIAQETLRSSLLGGQPISVIPNGVDTSVFAPTDREQVRRELGLPQDKRIILATADYLHDQRKGLRYLMNALRQIPDQAGTMLVTVGQGSPESLNELEMAHRNLGRLDDDHSLARIYGAADLFAAPSLYENLPNTALEALACGTPVVGFRTGGIPDIVKHGQTGLLADWRDATDLAKQIDWLLDHPEERNAMGIAARQLVVKYHTLERQANSFAELYQTLLSEVPSVHQATRNCDQGSR